MSKPTCTVMVGLPGLGKSTLVDDMTRMDPDLFVYSTDAIIERVAVHLGKSYNDVFDVSIRNAQQEADVLLAEAIKHKLDIVWDQTNLTVNKRRRVINLMKRSGYQLRCDCVLPPEAGWLDDQKVWASRLRNREGKIIPQHILTNMISSFTVPSVDEGFDIINFFNMYGALMAIDYDHA